MYSENVDIIYSVAGLTGNKILLDKKWRHQFDTNIKLVLRAVQHNNPDLILFDVMMPEMDGFETCRHLKADPSTSAIPIIFVTAKKETEDIIEGFRCGGVDYISKPFRQEEILSRVNTHLQLNHMMKSQQRLLEELNMALKEVTNLREILPICSYCKNIRDDKGVWHSVEDYVDQ